jgi:hypothetical protein
MRIYSPDGKRESRQFVLRLTTKTNLAVMHLKGFNVRLAEKDLKLWETIARKRGLSKTALLLDWIRESDDRTVANARVWEKRNLGNQGLRIQCD